MGSDGLVMKCLRDVVLLVGPRDSPALGQRIWINITSIHGRQAHGLGVPRNRSL